jgi:sporadic carbohydrate cluster protein (TIGR04323 family)
MIMFYGYVTSRSFSSLYIPVPAQNSVLREYCVRKNAIYVLPPLESFYPNCYHQLFGLLHDVPVNSNIIMYSLLMLPIDSSKKLSKLNSICSTKNIRFHFVLENFISSIQDQSFKNELLNYRLNSFKSPISSIFLYF